MPLMNVFVNMYGGKIEILSKTKQEFPTGHGTTIRIYLNKVTDLEVEYIEEFAS